MQMVVKVVEQLQPERVEQAEVVLLVEVIIMLLIGLVLEGAEVQAELVQLDLLLFGVVLEVEERGVLVLSQTSQE